MVAFALLSVCVCVAGCGSSGRVATRPKVGQCRTYGLATGRQTSNDTTTESCDGSHSAETFAVVDALPEPIDDQWSEAQRSTAEARSCTHDLAARWLGTSAARYATMRFGIAWFTPSAAQAADGARWIRCDVVTIDGPAPVAVTGRFRALVTQPGAFAKCAPKPAGRDGVAKRCAVGAKQLVAFDTSGPAGSALLKDGSNLTKTTAQGDCLNRSDDLARGEAPIYTAYPSQAEWSRGQHFAVCWMPFKNWTLSTSTFPTETAVADPKA